ncbi:hypothetical protein H6P81_020805 [Aristolochia fimbriata]|uniref:Uncharacterized protein n=1 Tax=Aristolochia fimbriata TaxID=158543 RepID=A0AAV7DVH3_ARIFI|nr:hypothetical protein H6P81_020805 [Aristolochia fimbriata]
MASRSSVRPARQLRELLREQQEPFLLDVYLLEKNYPRKCSDSEANGNDCLKSERLTGYRSRNRKEKALHKCSAVLRSVLGRFGHGARGERPESRGNCSVDGTFGNSSCSSGVPSETRLREENRVSIASCKTGSGSASEGEDMEDCGTSPTSFTRISAGLRRLELHSFKAQTRNQWRCNQDCKQRSPVSVFEVPTSDHGSPASSHNDSNPTSPLSSSQLEYLVEKIAQKMSLRINSEDQDLPGFPSSSSSSSSSQTITTKMVLKQTKKLLLDCIREAQQNYTKKTRWSTTPHAHTSIPNLENFVCEQILSWADYAATNGKHLARAYSFNSTSEWLQSEPQIREIGIAISDAIFVQTIDEAVTDMYMYANPSHLSA